MENIIALTPTGNTKVVIESWDQLKHGSPLIIRRFVVQGIKLFFTNKECEAEDIFMLLASLPDGMKIWGDLEYCGGFMEGYMTEQIRMSFLEKNAHDVKKNRLYGAFLKKPHQLNFN